MERGNFVAVIFFTIGMMVGGFSVMFIARNDAVAHEQLVGNRCVQACHTGALPLSN